MEINNSILCNCEVRTSIISINDKRYLVYLNDVGGSKAMVEDIETRKRTISAVFETGPDAVKDAINKMKATSF